MKEKTAQIKALKGIRNDIDVERLSVGDLVSAVNVDVDDSGKPNRRLGYTRRVACTPKSFWSNGSYGYLLDGTDLKLFTPPATLTVLRSGLSASKRIAFVSMNGVPHYTNGEVTGKIDQRVDKPWGIVVPAVPGATFIAGALKDGWYGYTMTYIRKGGRESGANRMQVVKAADGQGIRLTGVPISADPDVKMKRMYFTGRDGEVPMFVTDIPNAQTQYDYTHDVAGSVPVTTMFQGPPPSGHLLTYWNGRIFIAQGTALWYTEAFSPELVDYRKGFLSLGAEATVIAAVETGIFVATQDRTLFLRGDSPENFVLTEVAPYGAPLGNVVYADGAFIGDKGVPKTVAGWMSKMGYCVGLSDGTLMNLSQARYLMADAKRASTLFKQRGGLTQFITTLYTS